MNAKRKDMEVSTETRRALNDLARHQLILKLYADIRMDIAVCDIEGWDKMEFINMLYDVLEHFKKQQKQKQEVKLWHDL